MEGENPTLSKKHNCKSRTRVTGCELQVQTHELRVQMHELQEQSTSCKVKCTGWEMKSTSQEIKSMNSSNKTTTYIVNIWVKRKNSEFKRLNFTSYKRF